jgi:DUF1680 family protein
MTLITQQAMYADLLEWQLYNAVSVGIGLDGKSYLYNNPLESRMGMDRRDWFDVPCCPSNLSRVWASLSNYITSSDSENIWVHQYISSKSTLRSHGLDKLTLESALPWEGQMSISLELDQPKDYTIHLRVPSWAGDVQLKINAEVQEVTLPEATGLEDTASGYDPRRASYLSVFRTWENGDQIELIFPMAIEVRHQHPKIKSCAGRSALTRGPIVYCLESSDNPDVNIFECVIDASSLRPVYRDEHLGGCWVLQGKTINGENITAVPYMLWANRGKSQMTTMLHIEE